MITADTQIKNRKISVAISQGALIGWKKLKQKSYASDVE